MQSSLLQGGMNSSDQEIGQQRMRAGKGKDKSKPPRRGIGVAALERLRLQDKLSKNSTNEVPGFHIPDHTNPDYIRRALLSQIPPTILRDQYYATRNVAPPEVMNNHQLTELPCPYGPACNGGTAYVRVCEHLSNEHQRPLRSKMFANLDHHPDNCEFCIQDQERQNRINAKNMEETKQKADIDGDSRLRIGSGPKGTNNHQQEEIIVIEDDQEEMEIENENTIHGGSGRLMDDECGLSPPSKSRRSCNGESSSSSAYNPFNKDLSFADRPTGVVVGEASSSSATANASNAGEELDLSLKLSCGYTKK